MSHSVRITNLRVPHTYTLVRDREPDPLVLDCEVEIGAGEQGFVLKWLFNNHSIYQWIPSVKGFAMVSHEPFTPSGAVLSMCPFFLTFIKFP